LQFDLTTIEVDGSLRNPTVVVTVVIWAVILSLISAGAACLWARSRRATDVRARGRGVAAILVAAALYLATPLAQFAIGNALYVQRLGRVGREGGPSVISVGFWGGPPAWPAWGAGLLAGYLVLRRERRTNTDTSTP
jgi:hypothetical protein